MKIKTIAQLRKFAALIGTENVEARKKLLREGGELWIFQTPEELENNSDLSKKEKAECKKRFAETGGKYAGWYRPPTKSQQYIPGFTVSPDYDTHGNYRSNLGGCSGQWSH